MATAQITHAVGLDNLLNGGVNEVFQEQLIKALANITDPNTIAKDVRKITFEFALKPSANRDHVDVLVKAKSTCGGNHNEPLETSLVIVGSGEHVTATERLTA